VEMGVIEQTCQGDDDMRVEWWCSVDEWVVAWESSVAWTRVLD